MNLNKLLLAGNLTRDPELRYTPKGTALVKFSLAINRTYQAGTETKKDVTFVDVEAWGKTAENIGKNFRKGKSIFVEGRLQLQQWDDKQTGQKRSKLSVVCESFQFVERSEGQSAPAPAPVQAQAPAPAPAASVPSYAPAQSCDEPPMSDEVPF